MLTVIACYSHIGLFGKSSLQRDTDLEGSATLTPPLSLSVSSSADCIRTGWSAFARPLSSLALSGHRRRRQGLDKHLSTGGLFHHRMQAILSLARHVHCR